MDWTMISSTELVILDLYFNFFSTKNFMDGRPFLKQKLPDNYDWDEVKRKK